MKKRGRTETRDFAITYYEGDELRGLLHWEDRPRLSIDFLLVQAPAGLAPMLTAFRRKYPDTLVHFEVAEDNERMRRFVSLTGAQKTPDGYQLNTGPRALGEPT
ncbi:hypothetical protein HNO88_000320 [Novosphingobium chloroacetimidivorans]|uniref:Uncharacterized protein n=1 Tax=Novosphingobium chloroacetimidivorans TaxID=1428314 RepID=A0A7W7K7H6_9SPHN|nr:hypothetical protein [Novosphingobium chloroacetimidivorans]MBB4857023.1 hypothetical protein [Novosphingobium chloroacetimidivorans]